jgi:hypothetical protein
MLRFVTRGMRIARRESYSSILLSLASSSWRNILGEPCARCYKNTTREGLAQDVTKTQRGKGTACLGWATLRTADIPTLVPEARCYSFSLGEKPPTHALLSLRLSLLMRGTGGLREGVGALDEGRRRTGGVLGGEWKTWNGSFDMEFGGDGCTSATAQAGVSEKNVLQGEEAGGVDMWGGGGGAD